MPLPHDAGPDAAVDAGPDATAGDAGLDGGSACRRWLPLDGCEADDSCPDPSAVALGLRAVGSAMRPETATLESVSFIHGSDDRAVAMTAEQVLAEVLYGPDGVRFGRLREVPVDLVTQYTTAVKVHPSGEYAAVSVADADCAPGEVVLVGVGEDDFGDVLQRVEVGYGPDSVAFSPDGHWLVSADEDERSNRPCKPADRWGGSVTIVDVSGGPGSASVAQTLPVDHAPDSEPETVAVGTAGTVVVALQETDELLVLSLGDVPDAEGTIIPLLPDGAPDGVDVSDELGFAVAGLEHTDDFVVVDLATRTIVDRVDLVLSGDVPADYNRDTGDSTEVHEPEQVALFTYRGATFATFPLQESHVLMGYRIAEDGTLSFDSTAPTGVGWMDELGGHAMSRIRPEGVAARPEAGLFLVANEREGSLTLIETADATYGECP